MNEDKNKANEQLQMEITPEIADGIYANMACIAHSSAEVVLDFIRLLPGVPNAKVKSRIIMAPEHAKRLLLTLQNNLANYEKKYGEIRLSEAEPRTANPFHVKTGEA